MFNLLNLFRKQVLSDQEFKAALSSGQKDFSKLSLRVDFKGIDVSGVNFFKSDLQQSTNLKFAHHLSEANWQRSNLIGLDLSETSLRKIVLRRCKLKWTNFSDSDLEGANISWSSLAGANFSWTNLSGVNLSFSNVRGANFSQADFKGASLVWSNKRFANFSNCRPWQSAYEKKRWWQIFR